MFSLLANKSFKIYIWFSRFISLFLIKMDPKLKRKTLMIKLFIHSGYTCTRHDNTSACTLTLLSVSAGLKSFCFQWFFMLCMRWPFCLTHTQSLTSSISYLANKNTYSRVYILCHLYNKEKINLRILHFFHNSFSPGFKLLFLKLSYDSSSLIYLHILFQNPCFLIS